MSLNKELNYNFTINGLPIIGNSMQSKVNKQCSVIIQGILLCNMMLKTLNMQDSTLLSAFKIKSYITFFMQAFPNKTHEVLDFSIIPKESSNFHHCLMRSTPTILKSRENDFPSNLCWCNFLQPTGRQGLPLFVYYFYDCFTQ